MLIKNQQKSYCFIFRRQLRETVSKPLKIGQRGSCFEWTLSQIEYFCPFFAFNFGQRTVFPKKNDQF